MVFAQPKYNVRSGTLTSQVDRMRAKAPLLLSITSMLTLSISVAAYAQENGVTYIQCDGTTKSEDIENNIHSNKKIISETKYYKFQNGSFFSLGRSSDTPTMWVDLCHIVNSCQITDTSVYLYVSNPPDLTSGAEFKLDRVTGRLSHSSYATWDRSNDVTKRSKVRSQSIFEAQCKSISNPAVPRF